MGRIAPEHRLQAELASTQGLYRRYRDLADQFNGAVGGDDADNHERMLEAAKTKWLAARSPATIMVDLLAARAEDKASRQSQLEADFKGAEESLATQLGLLGRDETTTRLAESGLCDRQARVRRARDHRDDLQAKLAALE